MLLNDKIFLIINSFSSFYLNLAENKSALKNTFLNIAFLLLSVTFSVAQEKKKIIIENSDFVDMNQTEIPGAIVFTGNVRIIHNGVKMFCNKAYHFKDENYVKAFGNVQMNQGDTITIKITAAPGQTLQQLQNMIEGVLNRRDQQKQARVRSSYMDDE